MFLLTFLPLLLSVSSLPVIDQNIDDPFIKYGKKAKPGQFPWQVDLVVTLPSGRYSCGGALVGPDKVITAAHCLFDDDYQVESTHTLVHAGGVKQDRLEQTVSVKDFYLDPRWRSGGIVTMPYDYAELTLEKPFEIVEGSVETIEPAGREYIGIALERLNKCWVSGWGETESYEVSNDLLYYEAPIVSRDSRYVTIGTKARRAGTGEGDSGGPLVCEVDGKKYLFGATTGGVPGYTLSSFTEVSEFQ